MRLGTTYSDSLDPASAANSLLDLGSRFSALSLSFLMSEGGQLLSGTHLLGMLRVWLESVEVEMLSAK